MTFSSIEITDKEYHIKLNRDDFKLSFISQLLKRIEAERIFFSNHQDTFIADREEYQRFDRLEDK